MAVAVPRAGRTSIRSQAIRRIAQAAAAELAGVPARAVRAELADAHGALAVNVTTPLDNGPGALGAETLVERAASIVEAVSSCVDALAGRSVARVGVRFTAVRRDQERRVR